MARPRDPLPGMKPLLGLCAALLSVILGAGYLVYRQSAESIRQSADEHQEREVAFLKASVEDSISSLVDDMESWARQPVMAEILANDVNNEIEGFLEAVAERSTSLREISCVTADGKILTSSSVALAGTIIKYAETRRGMFEKGKQRGTIEPAGDTFIVTVPIFVEFDEKEFLGTLRGALASNAFLKINPDWWAGLADASGRLIAQLGPELPDRINLHVNEQECLGMGPIMKKFLHIDFPSGIDAPSWYVVTADRQKDLLGSVDLLGSTVRWMSLGCGLVMIILIGGYSRRQHTLMKHLVERSGQLAEASARNRALLESAPDGIITIDERGAIESYNAAAERTFGFKAAEIVGTSVGVLMPSPHREAHEGYIQRYVHSGDRRVIGQRQEVVGRRKDGSTIPLDLHVSELRLGARRLFTGIIRDITDRKRSEKELKEYAAALEQSNLAYQEARAAADEANEAKSSFLANMSHEIRTPMTAILGFSENLMEAQLSPSERLDCIQTIRRNAEHLLTLINDILDISKIEAGRLDIECILCSPCSVTAEVASLSRARTLAKGVQFHCEYKGPIPETIQSDPTRLRQILINLVGNAIKFTEKGSVRLVTHFLSDAPNPMMQFDIIDTGIGLTEAQREKLFEPFTQADSSTTRRFGGTGLGLTISKRLVTMLGGEIAVTSRFGEGTTFSVTVATGTLDGVRMLTDVSEAALGFLPEDACLEGDADQKRLDCHILLADDGIDNQRLISHILRKAGAAITVVENGQQAVDAALSATLHQRHADAPRPIDLILMDMQMPVMDGYAATRTLREKGYVGPIIALTAHAMASDRDKCIDAGCDDYASKPVDRKVLIATIRRRLSPHPVA